MASNTRPAAPHDVQRPREVLSLRTWRGRNCSYRAGDEQLQDNDHDEETQRWAEAICAARNQWSIRQHRDKLALRSGKLGQIEAERTLRMALAALSAGGTDDA